MGSGGHFSTSIGASYESVDGDDDELMYSDDEGSASDAYFDTPTAPAGGGATTPPVPASFVVPGGLLSVVPPPPLQQPILDGSKAQVSQQPGIRQRADTAPSLGEHNRVPGFAPSDQRSSCAHDNGTPDDCDDSAAEHQHLLPRVVSSPMRKEPLSLQTQMLDGENFRGPTAVVTTSNHNRARSWSSSGGQADHQQYPATGTENGNGRIGYGSFSLRQQAPSTEEATKRKNHSWSTLPTVDRRRSDSAELDFQAASQDPVHHRVKSYDGCYNERGRPSAEESLRPCRHSSSSPHHRYHSSHRSSPSHKHKGSSGHRRHRTASGPFPSLHDAAYSSGDGNELVTVHPHRPRLRKQKSDGSYGGQASPTPKSKLRRQKSDGSSSSRPRCGSYDDLGDDVVTLPKVPSSRPNSTTGQRQAEKRSKKNRKDKKKKKKRTLPPVDCLKQDGEGKRPSLIDVYSPPGTPSLGSDLLFPLAPHSEPCESREEFTSGNKHKRSSSQGKRRERKLRRMRKEWSAREKAVKEVRGTKQPIRCRDSAFVFLFFLQLFVVALLAARFGSGALAIAETKGEDRGMFRGVQKRCSDGCHADVGVEQEDGGVPTAADNTPLANMDRRNLRWLFFMSDNWDAQGKAALRGGRLSRANVDSANARAVGRLAGSDSPRTNARFFGCRHLSAASQALRSALRRTTDSIKGGGGALSLDNLAPGRNGDAAEPSNAVAPSKADHDNPRGAEPASHPSLPSSIAIDYRNVIVLCVINSLYASILSAITIGFMLILARSLIQVSLVFSVIMSAAWAIVGWALTPNNVVPLLGIVFLILSLGYTVIVWDRIPFAATNLNTGLCAMRCTADIIFLGIGMLVVAFAWCVLWAVAFVGLHEAMNVGEVEAAGTTFVYIALLLSFFWTNEVIKNIVQVTVAGTVGTWWFYPEDVSPCCSSAVRKPFISSLSTSLGSICLGSLTVRPARLICRLVGLCCGSGLTKSDRRRSSVSSCSSQRDDPEEISGKGMCCSSVTSLISPAHRFAMNCRNELSRHFNKFSFTYIGLYGYKFADAGEKATILFQTREWTDVIRDDLIHNVLVMASIVIGGCTGCFGLLVEEVDGYAFTSFHAPLMMAFLIGLGIGLVLSGVLLSIIDSAVNTVFVCYAAGPLEFHQNHPRLSNEMRDSWSQLWSDRPK